MTDDWSQGVDVLVVGAGPVGLTAACELTRHGASCRVIDRDEGPTPPHESRALALWERTLEVFAHVGVVDRVIAEARRVHGMNVYAGDRRLVHVGLDLHGAETPYPFTLILPQGQTEQILLDRLEAYGSRVDWRTRLTGVAQDESGVTATLEFPDGRSRTVRAGWLVGSDGPRSDVRHALGLTFEGGDYEETFLLADARIDWPLTDEEVHLLLQPGGGAVAAFPLPAKGLWRLVDLTGVVTPAEPDAVVARFNALLRDGGQPGAVVRDPTWTSSFRIHRRIAERFRVGRVFLAGDAAHVHSPAGGQGMNTGVQDAHNLAWKLAVAARGRAGEALLASYEPERRPVAEHVLKGTDRVTQVVTLRGEVSRLVRNQVASVLGQFEFVRRQIIGNLSELRISYRHSPCVAEERGGLLAALAGALDFDSAPRAGDRAPDVVLTPDTSDASAHLFDALTASGPRHTLFLFAGRDAEGVDAALVPVAALARDRYADLIRPVLVTTEGGTLDGLDVLPDPSGALHDRYGAGSACLYLIRPDGHVGYRSQPPDAEKLRAYLARVYT